MEELEDFNRHLSTLDPQQREEWSAALSDPAGMVSSMSATRGRGGETFSVIGTELARAHLNQPGRPRVQIPTVHTGPSYGQLAARHIQLAMRAGDANSERGWLAVMQQMNRTPRRLRDASQARGELAAAYALSTKASAQMQIVTKQLGSEHGTSGVNFDDLDELGQQRFISEAIRQGVRTRPCQQTPRTPRPDALRRSHDVTAVAAPCDPPAKSVASARSGSSS